MTKTTLQLESLLLFIINRVFLAELDLFTRQNFGTQISLITLITDIVMSLGATQNYLTTLHKQPSKIITHINAGEYNLQ